ncbi:LL-diaminopimelate aminotransferase [Treponema rectale]|uniref:LL-diaminopimelate aminotransferase n=1 Tax=Treponema rectale TaxID=744512 RepID=A0A7M1XK68_9SPIR|nr:LL-diaminopimelate aminotransferase [Treponema rectale]
MSVKLNDHFDDLVKNYLFSEVGKRVKAYQEKNPDKKIIRLGIGDVTLPLSKVVVNAMQAAVLEMGMKSTFKGYPPEYGYDFLRKAIVDYYLKNDNVNLDMEDVFVSDGAKSDCGNIVEIFGDNPILIPDPVYPVYMDSNIMAGRKVTLVNATKENFFLPSPEGIKEDSYIIYLCSPNNPTGAVYDHKGLKAWVDFALKTGSLIIFDSAYESYVEGDEPRSIYEIEGAKACAIEICSLSKSAGFTGVRCSWTIIPSQLIIEGKSLNQLWARRQATKFNGVPYIVQKGAEAALKEEGLRQSKETIAYYKRNAKLLTDLLTKKGVFFTGGISSPYIWMKTKDNMTSWEFFDELLSKVQIVGTPGSGFGKNGEGFFRLTAFGSYEDTLEAVKRLDELL